ncbi:MAG: response regulator [Candidatus Schekmanbacteria bacterium]|nr:response regulator [Candidatus Schekmanbacteria bacterium]
MRDEAGEVEGILGILIDITDRKQMELELTRAKDAAEQAARARSQFITNVSHELRTPLTLILGPVKDALEDAGLNAGTRELLARVQRNGFRLYNLVNDILDFAKLEAGRVSVRYERFDVLPWLASLISDLQPLAQARGLSLRFSPRVESLVAAVDPSLLERIVLNLLSNALKFTNAGGGVEVVLAVAGESMRLQISDTGIGIAKEELDRLFRPFAQVDSSATRRFGGTGLGLVVVRGVTEALGGSVTVESERGRGSTFTVQLPANPAGAAAVTGALPDAEATVTVELGSTAWQRRMGESTLGGEAVKSASTPVAHGRRPSVLVADDDPDMRAYVAATLHELSVTAVADGARAWAALNTLAFDAVVTDVMMPELDGIALTARIKADARLKHLPVLMLTAWGGSESAATGLDAGADDYVHKPFVAEELRARVRAAVRNSQLQRALREKSREAGMAGVASGILHNVGNVLCSINLSMGLLRDGCERSSVDLLEKLASLVANEGRDPATLAAFLTSDPRGRQIPQSLSAIAEQLLKERSGIRTELAALRQQLEHITAIVGAQQAWARPSVELTLVELPRILSEAVLMSRLAAGGPHIRIERDLGAVPALTTDAHAVLQVLINLLNNAKQALTESTVEPKVLRIQTRLDGQHAATIAISDNGVGIAPESLPHIFEPGFTAWPVGHGLGLGLHTSAIAAEEMGWALAAHSDGPGRGATFSVTLPLGGHDHG